MFQQPAHLTTAAGSALATNKVLRNTYLLLSMTLLFSAATAGYAFLTNAAPVGGIFSLVIAIGLLFVIQALRNSIWGIVAVFAFTGFLGYNLGPILNHYVSTYTNGSQIIATSLGATGIIFFALSGYVLTTRKNFEFLGGFLFVGLCVAILAVLANIFLQLPFLHLAINAAIVLIFSGYILYDTSRIIHGGETNYIVATVALYLNIYNLFVSLLQLLGAFSGNND